MNSVCPAKTSDLAPCTSQEVNGAASFKKKIFILSLPYVIALVLVIL